MLDVILGNMFVMIYACFAFVIVILALHGLKRVGFLRNTSLTFLMIVGVAVVILLNLMGLPVIPLLTRTGSEMEYGANMTILSMFSNPDPKVVIFVIVILGCVSQYISVKNRRAHAKNQQQQQGQDKSKDDNGETKPPETNQEEEAKPSDDDNGSTTTEADNTDW